MGAARDPWEAVESGDFGARKLAWEAMYMRLVCPEGFESWIN